jgi:A/G-specific adenine glycosylase
MLDSSQTREFQNALLSWFDRHKRDLPWRRTTDPYAIWISEIMLQQTRVAAVISFYERFLNRFPDFRALADAPEADLLAQWAGLGYYSRARNLQKAAQNMRERGHFPRSHVDIRSLPGVGDYTSAAVASIGFNLPFAAVDGNVLRVMSRVLADSVDIGTATGRKHFSVVAQELLAQEQPGEFNQAMMELGATVCLPKNPQCLLCPVAQLCRARQSGRQDEFPIKLRRAKAVFEDRVVYWIEREGRLLLWERPASSRLMPGFLELPERAQLPGVGAGQEAGNFRHGITFHNYRFQVRTAEAPADLGECRWVEIHLLPTVPVSTVVRKAHRVMKRAVRQAATAG